MKIESTMLTLLMSFAIACSGADASGEDVDDGQQALSATGESFPGDKCVRVNKTTHKGTYGDCASVCKGKIVYNPSPSEDPAGTKGRCYEARIANVPRNAIGASTAVGAAIEN